MTDDEITQLLWNTGRAKGLNSEDTTRYRCKHNYVFVSGVEYRLNTHKNDDGTFDIGVGHEASYGYRYY
jgi:hypothetical protein